MTGQQLEVFAHGDRTRLRQLHQLAGAPSLIPDSFKDAQTGTVRWGEVALACYHCESLGLDPVRDIKNFPVVKGQVFPTAEAWVVLANRHGWTVMAIIDTPERCVVRMRHPERPDPPDYERTFEEASQLGSAPSNPNYRGAGRRSMIRAGALRTAIKLNAPEVMQDPRARDWARTEITGPADQEREQSGPIDAPGVLRGEVETGAAAGPEPPPRRAPADPAVASALLDTIDQLPEAVRADLRAECRKVELPNIRSDRFNLADAALLARLIPEALERHVPEHVYDDAPEAATHDPDDGYRYDPDDNQGTPQYTPEEMEPF